jgi:ribulose kinase
MNPSDQEEYEAETETEEDVQGWLRSYWTQIGLDILMKDGFQRLGRKIASPGKALGSGLCASAAMEMGLNVGTPVAVGMIDAHAGALALLACEETSSMEDHDVPTTMPQQQHLETKLAIIGGTSTCQLAVHPTPRFVDGIWGPYFGALLPDLWLNEGGQSATGALIAHILNSNSILETQAKVWDLSISFMLPS